ncbi:MAG TPA: hypothetical protein VKM94_17545, partial [Blastocatellia bacterium]|nr:hypothetical protein [Blastocatellia bacterium]
MKSAISKGTVLLSSLAALVLVALGTAASAQTGTAASSSAPRLQLQRCNNPKLDEAARCGKYEVFEDRAART